LTYGASLTAGFCNNGDHFEPYGLELAKSLAPKFDTEVWSCGLSGLTAEAMARDIKSCRIIDTCGRSGQGISMVLKKKGRLTLRSSWRARTIFVTLGHLELKL
jgi:hypothetical protein